MRLLATLRPFRPQASLPAASSLSTGEHDVGLHKMQHLVEEHGPHAVALMHSIKRALDPHNIFNPAKVVRFG